MKKITLVLAVLLAAAPAMAIVTITATQVGTSDEVDLIVTWSGEGSPPRAFAIDVNVGGGQTITGVSGYHTGESNAPGNKGFGVFPASFNREIDADDPDWDDANYTPVADACDLPGDTLGGIGTSGVTLELGSLYKGAPNVPTSPSTLATIKVSGDCTICFARNVGRGKVVLEDGNEPASFSAPCFGMAIVCTVPDVVGDANLVAQAAIVAANFTVGTVTADCCDTIAAGNVFSQTPGPGVATCGTPVDIVVSTGPCALCPGDVTDTVTGFVPGGPPLFIDSFDINLWQGPSGTLNSTDVQALNYLVVEYLGSVPSSDPNYAIAAAGDVTGTVTGFVPGGPPLFIDTFDMNLWEGPDGTINPTDVQALNYLVVDSNGAYTCP